MAPQKYWFWPGERKVCWLVALGWDGCGGGEQGGVGEDWTVREVILCLDWDSVQC